MRNLPFRLGAHPINWVGEDVKEHGADITFEQIVDDMQRLGLAGTEMGRKFPTDVQVLKRELTARNLQLVSQWKSVLFSDSAYHEPELKAYRRHVQFLSEMGSPVISTCEIGGSLHFDPRLTPHEKEVHPLDRTGWECLADGLNAAGAIAREYGMKLAYHHHGGTVVERPEEIDLLMEATDPQLVYLLYDTGHAYYGGADPLTLLRKHYTRVAYVHLKDVRKDVLEEARAEQADFLTCIRKGAFTVPGTGDLDFRPILEELVARGYSGWAMLEGEQDPRAYPPYEFAAQALRHIDSILSMKAGGNARMTYISFPTDRRFDCTSIGRLCIDLNANEINRPMEQTTTFTKYVGGSPANISIGMSRLGMKTAFIGKIANDPMGRFILGYLTDNRIDTGNVTTDHTGAVTGLAFTEIRSPSECSILMYRDNVADLKLTPDEVSEELISRTKMLLVSGTALAQSPSREAVLHSLIYAKRHGVVIVFDLDYRPYTWKSAEETAVYYNLAAEKSDILLGTREEFDQMERFDRNPDHNDQVTAAKWFEQSAKIVVIKHGQAGSIAYTNDGSSHRAKPFPAKVIKTFGAGDSYAAAFLYGLQQGWPVETCMEYGSAAACIVISSHSCSDAMPSTDQITEYIARCERGEIVV